MTNQDGIIESEPFEMREEKLKTYTGWYAPSMFGTNYGKYGYKIEVSAYYYFRGKMRNDLGKGNRGYNCDGRTMREAKTLFWKQWNEDHPNKELWIGKFMSSWGL